MRSLVGSRAIALSASHIPFPAKTVVGLLGVVGGFCGFSGDGGEEHSRFCELVELGFCADGGELCIVAASDSGECTTKDCDVAC